MKRFSLGIITAIAFAGLVGLVTVWAGGYNVAATVPHTDVGKWAITTNMKNSVEGNAQAVVVPAGFPTDVRALSWRAGGGARRMGQGSVAKAAVAFRSCERMELR